MSVEGMSKQMCKVYRFANRYFCILFPNIQGFVQTAKNPMPYNKVNRPVFVIKKP